MMNRIKTFFWTVALSPVLAAAALAQPDTSFTSTTTTSTTTSSEWISDWRLWAVVGAVLVVILVIALTRGRGDADRTTIVK
jgi:hypothetical protein